MLTFIRLFTNYIMLKMKKLFYLTFVVALLTSCGEEGNSDLLNDELEQLRQENIELKQQAEEVTEKDSLINEYAQFILDIQSNLNAINQKENTLILKSKNPELNRGDSSIVNDLKTLGVLLAENKSKVNSMKSKLNNANIQIEDLENVVLKLTEQVEEKDREIMGLKGELSDLGVAFDELLAAYEDNIVVLAEKNQTIETQKEELNTAYYTVGSGRELKENGVITKEGGFIGLGKTKKLKQDFNKSYFTKVDITQTTTISLGSNKVNIITTHPENSYTINGDLLKISKPKEFWSASKYLVIEVK